jgi:hypothetical protein
MLLLLVLLSVSALGALLARACALRRAKFTFNAVLSLSSRFCFADETDFLSGVLGVLSAMRHCLQHLPSRVQITLAWRLNWV